MKEGDWVWYGPNEVEYIYGSGDIDIQRRDDDAVVNTYPEYLIPDVPNLPAIARFLAEYPETVDALETISGLAGDAMTSAAIQGRASGTQTYTMLGEHQKAQDVVDAFVKAMRGEGGHE